MMARIHGGDFICVDGHVSVNQDPFIKAIVRGSKHISRDPLDHAESVLDVEGDSAFHREAQKGEWEDFLMCSSPKHKGAKWLPFTQFSTDNSTPTQRNRYCRVCRADAEYERRLKEAARRGVNLRDRPGRPPQRKKGK